MYKHILLLAAIVALVTGFPVNDASPGEHIQHVTIPPSATTTASNSHIGRVPSIQTSGPESTTEARPIQQAVESSSETSTSTQHVEETTLSEAASENDVTTDVPVAVDIEEGIVVIPQPREDPQMPEDDLVTANFWWGLGPIYPHLYQFKRVPHLVPIHSFNPYHDYYAYHKKYPTQYSF